MNVAQLIEALRAMPQDAEIVSHANNHTSGTHDTCSVAAGMLQGKPVVVIGNWSSYALDRWANCNNDPDIVEPIYFVPRYGDDAGQLVKGAVVRHPAKRVPLTRYEERPARSEIVKA